MVSRNLTYMAAIREAFAEEMARDSRVLVTGVDVRHGILGVTSGLSEQYPDRVIDTPVAEDAFTNLAVGMALAGLRPIVEITFSNFVTLAWNALCNHAAAWRYMHGGQFKVPLVVYCFDGAVMSLGAHHSQTLGPLFATAPGLKVVVPSTPADAKGLMKAAIREDDPVLFCGHLALMGTSGEVPDGDHVVPLGAAAVRREGQDVTVVATQAMVQKGLNVAEILAREGVEVEVIDPRSLVPLDYETILASVRKTGRLVTVEESHRRGGFGAELAAVIQERAFFDLDAPVRRVGAPAVPVPGSATLERAYVPQEGGILAAVRRVLQEG